jgi:hypothetical protein
MAMIDDPPLQVQDGVYIFVEFRSNTEFTELLERVDGINSLSSTDKQAQLTTKTAESYCKPFMKDSNNERTMSRNSMGSPTSRSKQGFLAGRKEEDILLVYPFDGDDELIEKCANDFLVRKKWWSRPWSNARILVAATSDYTVHKLDHLYSICPACRRPSSAMRSSG